jgi:predicted porin
MKKSLFAIAAVTAFAGAAQAQSSVTVYGILDVGYIGANTRVNSSGNTTTNGATKKTVNQFGQSAETSSRLGFKGVEDLGGGTSAFFTAEFALAPNDQTLSGNSTSAAGLSNRQTFVGLKKNGIGQMAVGTQYTTVFNALAATDPGQTNNMVGSVIYPQNSTGNNTADLGNNVALTPRTSNALSVKSDKFAGFTGSAFATMNNKNDTEVKTATVTTGGNTNASGWGLGADYAIQKFYVAAAYQSLKQLTTASNGGVTAATGAVPAAWNQAQANGASAAPVGAAAAINSTDNQLFVGATYDFGILKAYANYTSRKVTSTASSNYYLKRSAEQIGVRSYITPTIEGWASAGLGRFTEFGSGTPTQNFNAWQLGSNYYLSKRTNLYAIYGQTLASNGNGTFTAGSTAQTTRSSGASNYAIGVRHTF